MMIGIVARKGRGMPAVAHHSVGLAEPEQIDIEALARVEVRLPQCKVTKPPGLERPRKHDASNIIHLVRAHHGKAPLNPPVNLVASHYYIAASRASSASGK